LNIYSIVGAEGFQLCHPADDADYHTIDALIDGTPRARTWRPIRMRLVNFDCGRKLKESDSPWLGSWALIFRRSAVEAIGNLLTQFGELLPLECSDADLFIYNTTCFVDALDFVRSDVIELDPGVVKSVINPVLLSRSLGAQQMFKLKRVITSGTFAGEKIKQAWERANLRGLSFTKRPVV
jgi:hypothetical protein